MSTQAALLRANPLNTVELFILHQCQNRRGIRYLLAGVETSALKEYLEAIEPTPLAKEAWRNFNKVMEDVHLGWNPKIMKGEIMSTQTTEPQSIPLPPRNLTVGQWLDNVGEHSGIAYLESYHDRLHGEGRLVEAEAIYLLIIKISEGWMES